MPFVQVGDIRLHYLEHGSGPEPLVFIHGYTGSANTWIDTLPRLPERYRAIAFDLRGAGESDKPAGGYGPAVYAEDIDAATRALGIDTFTLVGHSLGGVTAMQSAVNHPERLRRLVLVAPAPSGGVVVDLAVRQQMKALRSNKELVTQFTRMMNPRPLREELLDLSFDDAQKWPEVALDEAWQALVDLRLSEAIAKLTMPTLVVVGDRDALRAANLADAARIPNCALHVFYRVGHLIPYDVPDEFVALIDDFITNGAAPPAMFPSPTTGRTAATSAGAGGASVTAAEAVAPSSASPSSPSATTPAAVVAPALNGSATTANGLEPRELDLIHAVRELARGPFMERAAAYDREGRFPHENVAELKRLGIAGLSLAAEQGGLGLSPLAQMRVMEEMAYGDASTAVAFNMHRIGADIVSVLPPFAARDAALRDMAANGALFCAPGSIPTGELDNRRSGFTAVESGAGYVVSGRAGFASMSEGATYMLLVATIDRGVNAAGERNEPDVLFSVPRLDTSGIALLHNWDAMGLRGTASHDVQCDGLTLARADALVIPMAMLRAIFQTLQAQGGVLAQRRSLGTLGILAIWLGLAQAAFDFTVEYVAQRHGYLAGTSSALGPPPGFRSEQPWAQSAIGNMEHWLETGRTIFYDTVARVETPAADPQTFTRHLVRTVYHLRRMSEEVGMGAMKVCGAHAYVRSRPLERIFRDLMGGVVMAWKTDELVQTLGRGALGMPITIVGPAGS